MNRRDFLRSALASMAAILVLPQMCAPGAPVVGEALAVALPVREIDMGRLVRVIPDRNPFDLLLEKSRRSGAPLVYRHFGLEEPTS